MLPQLESGEVASASASRPGRQLGSLERPEGCRDVRLFASGRALRRFYSNNHIETATLENCRLACLSQTAYRCRSLSYSPKSLLCSMSELSPTIRPHSAVSLTDPDPRYDFYAAPDCPPDTEAPLISPLQTPSTVALTFATRYPPFTRHPSLPKSTPAAPIFLPRPTTGSLDPHVTTGSSSEPLVLTPDEVHSNSLSALPEPEPVLLNDDLGSFDDDSGTPLFLPPRPLTPTLLTSGRPPSFSAPAHASPPALPTLPSLPSFPSPPPLVFDPPKRIRPALASPRRSNTSSRHGMAHVVVH